MRVGRWVWAIQNSNDDLSMDLEVLHASGSDPIAKDEEGGLLHGIT